MFVSFAMVFVVRYSLTFFSVCGSASFLTVLKLVGFEFNCNESNIYS